ncbi:hypothetical protein TEA_006473 [Camellia sinensis var. sinensis]|uniref:GATA-type domain-containing protein n=1 Tax=Camellia sinensis var. sinensis TaxID=542762 RepID=A0A4S4F1Q8_CAMSN|nr:hypothetical protein TEA_006473 [Camellia sinensis var. sinensis]
MRNVTAARSSNLEIVFIDFVKYDRFGDRLHRLRAQISNFSYSKSLRSRSRIEESRNRSRIEELRPTVEVVRSDQAANTSSASSRVPCASVAWLKSRLRRSPGTCTGAKGVPCLARRTFHNTGSEDEEFWVCVMACIQIVTAQVAFCVMSEVSRDLGASAEPNKIGPDYFAFYAREVAELLSQDEDFLAFSSETSEVAGMMNGDVGEKDATGSNHSGKDNTFSGSLFCNGVGARLSDFKKERLKALLRQSVVTLSQEVDEMLDPVIAIRHIQSQLRYKKSLSNYSATACDEGDVEQHPHKKIKLSSSISIPLHASPIGAKDSGNKGKDADLPENGRSNGVKKNCAHCHTAKTSKWRTGSEGPLSICNGCGIKFEEEKEPPSINDHNKESCLVSNIGADDEYREVDDDMQFLLENDAPKVEAVVKKHSDEVFTMLGHMEQQLEELLDTVLSNCRLMTLSEKQQLRKLIQKLPPRNLDRVVEIIQCNKPFGKYSADEIHDNVTLWRLYYYVKAVDNARELSG